MSDEIEVGDIVAFAIILDPVQAYCLLDLDGEKYKGVQPNANMGIGSIVEVVDTGFVIKNAMFGEFRKTKEAFVRLATREEREFLSHGLII